MSDWSIVPAVSNRCPWPWKCPPVVPDEVPSSPEASIWGVPRPVSVSVSSRTAPLRGCLY